MAMVVDEDDAATQIMLVHHVARNRLLINLGVLFVTASVLSCTTYAIHLNDAHVIAYFTDVGSSYDAQMQWYYCAPASVRMILKYEGLGSLPSQELLASQMNCTEYNNGTKISNLLFAIAQYGIPYNVDQGRAFSESLLFLKSKLVDNKPLIIAIWFDKNTDNGHFVVVYGYNCDGIFVHDPWNNPLHAPVGRPYGPSAFIPNDQLELLWSHYSNWMVYFG